MNEIKFEVCLQTIDDVVAAAQGGAHRVELCSALVEGGLTPSRGVIESAATMDIDVMVIIRPRGGDFDYSPRELEAMQRDIAVCREIGVTGVVFGMLNKQGDVAGPQVRRMVEEADGLSVTFHRAFDVCRDPYAALEQLVDLGVDRILTSGQAATVPEGTEMIAKLVDQAGDRIGILPGAGITPENVREVIERTGAREFHATAFERLVSRMEYRNPQVFMGIPGLPEYERSVVSPEVVRNFLRAANGEETKVRKEKKWG